ncbi:Fe3+-siderophore ABC transporter permease [Bacillus sp. AK031]
MIQVLFVILIWILPTFLFTNAFFKMDKEEQQKFKNELQQPLVLFGVGLIIIGLLLSFSGIILAIDWIQHIGAIMVFISWLTASIQSWKKGKTGFRKSTALFFLGITGISAYGYLYFS